MKRYCNHCEEEHVVSPTYDTEGNLVGYFCNRVKMLTTAESSYWNGTDLLPIIHAYTNENLDEDVFDKLSDDRTIHLAKRFAYRLLQTEWAKEQRINFAFLAYWFDLDLKSRKAGE